MPGRRPKRSPSSKKANDLVTAPPRFKGASISDLAAACGSSKSLIYHYFPSKDDILHEVMAAHLDALVDAAYDAMQAGRAKERLRALTLAFMQLYVGAQDSHKVLLNELDNLPPGRRAEVVRKQRRIIAVVESLVREIRADAGPAMLPLTMLFFGMINWTHTWFQPGGPVSAEELADLAVDMMLNGLETMKL